MRQEHDEQVAAGEFDQWNADDLRSSAIDRRKRAEELVREREEREAEEKTEAERIKRYEGCYRP